MNKLLFVIVLVSISTLVRTQNIENSLMKDVKHCLENRNSKERIDYYLLKHMKGVPYETFVAKDINGTLIYTGVFNDFFLVNYWFKGCSPCEAEKVWLNKLSNKFPNIRFVSISKDSKQNFDDNVSRRLNWICIPDYLNQEIPETSIGYPLTFLVDGNGQIELFFLGGIKNQSNLNLIVDKLKE